MGLQREERGFGRRNGSLHARSQEKKVQFLLLLPNPTSGSARNTSSAQARHPCGFTGEGSPAATPALLLLLSPDPSASERSLCHHQIPLPVRDPSASTCSPQQAVTTLLPSSSSGTANVPTSAMPRGALGPPAPLNPHTPTAPGTSSAPTAMEGRKEFLEGNEEWRQLVQALPKRSRS